MDSCVRIRHGFYEVEYYANTGAREKLSPVPFGPLITTDDSSSIILRSYYTNQYSDIS